MPESLPPPPPPTTSNREPEEATIPALEGVNPLYRDRDVAVHSALLYGYTRFLKRPRASLRAIWEQERVGPEEDAPYIRDILSWPYFNDYARNAQWKPRREEHWTDIKAAVERKIKDDAIQQTLDEIGTLDAAEGALLDHILGNPVKGIDQVKPRSLEGAVNAVAKLVEVRGKMRDRVIERAAEAAADVDARENDNTITVEGVTTPVGSAGASALLTGDDGFDDEAIEAMAVAMATAEAERQSEALRAARPPPPPETTNELLRGDEPPAPGIEEATTTHGGDDNDEGQPEIP